MRFRTSEALCVMAGVDPNDVTAVTYAHRVGGYPTITVEVIARDEEGELILNDNEVDRRTLAFEWRRVA